MMDNSKKDQLLHTCAWCTQEIDENEDIFGFGANASHDIDLEGKEGEFVSLNLSLRYKTVFALVPEKTIDPSMAGFDLLFITCSEHCAQSLKDELDIEREVFENR